MPQIPDNLEPLLAGYVDGTLSKDELARVEAFLDQQPELRDELQRMMLDSEYLRMLPQARLPQDVSDTVGSQLEREMLLSHAGAPTRAAQQRFGLPGLAVAAMVLMGAGIGVVALQILGSERQSLPSLATRDAAPPVEALPTTGRSAEEALADDARSREFGASAPAIAAISPAISPATLDALPAAIEDEVVARIDLSEVADRPVVMVVESADLGRADRQVRGFLMDNGYAYLSSDDAHFPADALARGFRRGNDASAASGGAAATPVPPAPGAVVSNTAPPNAIGNAIEVTRADREPTILLARRVDLSVVRQLQSQLNDASVAGELVARDGTDRARYQPPPQQQQRAAIYAASVGDLKLKQVASMQKAQQQPAGPSGDPAGASNAPNAANEPDALASSPQPAPPTPPTPAAPTPDASAAPATTASPADAPPAARLVQPGDVLSITLHADAQMQVNFSAAVQVTVDADGFIDVPDRGVYQVRGLTARQVAATLAGFKDAGAPAPFAVVIRDRQANADVDAAKPEASRPAAPTTAPTTAPAVVGPATAPEGNTEARAARDVDRVDLIIVVKPLAPPSDESAAPTTVPTR